MKASDIQIGDWLRLRYTCRDTGREVIKDFRVAQIRCCGNDGPLYVWSEKGNMGVVEKLEPIPITPEILEKSSLGRNGHYGIYDEYFDLTIKEVSDSLWVFRYECTEMGGVPFTQSVVSFVHELQQELRKHCIDVEIKL